MKLALCLAVINVLGVLSATASAQDPLTLGSAVTGNISGGQSRVYVFRADAGDLVVGQAQLAGLDGTLSFLDASGHHVEGTKVRQWFLGSRRVGFVPPRSGEYQLRIDASGTAQGTYRLQLERLTALDRMRGVSVTSKVIDKSPRLVKLIADVQQGQVEAIRQFWQERAGTGPLLETMQDNNQNVLVTFLWRETFATYNVLVSWPMAAFRADDYYMSHIPNTDIWYKTIRLRRGSRFTYLLVPNDRPGDSVYTAQLDPLNPLKFPDDPNSMVDLSSVLETPGAPDESWVRRSPATRGLVEQGRFKSNLLGNERDIWVYTPPGYASSKGPYPLLLLFDGASYVRTDFNNAPTTLDNLIAAGRMRPAVVCFVDSLNRATDLGYDGVGAYADAIVHELLPQLASKYALTTSARDRLVGGASAGGLGASLVALHHPDVFGNVLSQSGFFRAPQSARDEPNTIAQMYAAAPKLQIRFYLETGLYENAPSGSLPLHDLVLDEGITASNRHFRDVLIAKGYDVTYRETATAHESLHWRATLADALMVLLKP